MTPPDEKTRAQIVKSVVAAVRVSPDKLTKKAYQWISQRGGFIAHYDYNGFIAEYSTRESLRVALQVSAENCYSLHVNTGPGEKYHDHKVWNAETMRQVLSTLDIRPHGREAVVTGLTPQEPKSTEEEVIALLEAE